MASANRKTGNSSTKSSGSTRQRSPSGKAALTSSTRSGSRRSVKKTPLITVLKDSSAGRFILVTFAVLCVLGVDFLVSLNQFDRFFMLLGIELIAAVLIGWILFVLHGRNDEDN